MLSVPSVCTCYRKRAYRYGQPISKTCRKNQPTMDTVLGPLRSLSLQRHQRFVNYLYQKVVHVCMYDEIVSRYSMAQNIIDCTNVHV